MPRPDPIESPRLSVLRRFRRIMKWMALFSITVAAIAVLLVVRGDNGTHIHMLIATALGAGLSVLLAGALMSLVFLSSSSGHDDEASRFEEEEDN
jgi:drug/metabolite transporter (DMT)-like permease